MVKFGQKNIFVLNKLINIYKEKTTFIIQNHPNSPNRRQ